jgi:hypothetical protein
MNGFEKLSAVRSFFRPSLHIGWPCDARIPRIFSKHSGNEKKRTNANMSRERAQPIAKTQQRNLFLHAPRISSLTLTPVLLSTRAKWCWSLVTASVLEPRYYVCSHTMVDNLEKMSMICPLPNDPGGTTPELHLAGMHPSSLARKWRTVTYGPYWRVQRTRVQKEG